MSDPPFWDKISYITKVGVEERMEKKKEKKEWK